MSIIVQLESREAGLEEFEYDTYDEAIAGAGRLVHAAARERGRDGIDRKVIVLIGDAREGESEDW